MNTLKAKCIIYCETCGDKVIRRKSIKVKSSNEADAKLEARNKIDKWKFSLKGQDCSFCKRIKKELAE